jgi:hypothetical protein
MLKLGYVLLAIAVLSSPALAQAQTPADVDPEAAEMAAEFIGAPVFAADGAEVGEVADISFDQEGRPYRLRISTGIALGLGERTLEIPKSTFIALRRAVVLDLPAEAVTALPELAESEDEK